MCITPSPHSFVLLRSLLRTVKAHFPRSPEISDTIGDEGHSVPDEQASRVGCRASETTSRTPLSPRGRVGPETRQRTTKTSLCQGRDSRRLHGSFARLSVLAWSLASRQRLSRLALGYPCASHHDEPEDHGTPTSLDAGVAAEASELSRAAYFSRPPPMPLLPLTYPPRVFHELRHRNRRFCVGGR